MNHVVTSFIEISQESLDTTFFCMKERLAEKKLFYVAHVFWARMLLEDTRFMQRCNDFVLLPTEDVS